MKSETSRIDTVVLDLEETIPADVQAKLYKLCKKRNLPWPEGIVVLMQEVLEGADAAKNEKSDRQGQARTTKNVDRQGQARTTKNVDRQGQARTKSERRPRSGKKNATNRRQPKPSTSTSSLRHRKAR